MINTKSKLSFFTPEKATKLLSFQSANNASRKLVISTNWLALFGFEVAAPTVERTLRQGKGIVIKRIRELFSDVKTKKVYSRTYKSRRNNPIETLLDIRSRKLLDYSFAGSCTRVHITFTIDTITVVPITTIQERAIANARNTNQLLSAFCACTSGVDLESLVSNGFTIDSVIEYRPRENRDKTDLTETGALNVINNFPIMNLYNQDIMEIDPKLIASDYAKNPSIIFQASVQCDDYSTAKNAKAKQSSYEDTSSTLDMSYDMLRLIEEMAPPTVLFENVGGWVKSDMYKIMSLRLRRWGYKEHLIVADARDFGGLTSRKRAYCFFSALPASFSFEDKQPRSQVPIVDIVQQYLPECRDVTHSKSLTDGITCNRLRIITDESIHSPTPLKSQSRMAKDSLVYIDSQNRIKWPSEGMLKRLLGISPKFSLEAVSGTIASEIIGQSIDVPLHDSILRAVKKHILEFYSQLKSIAA